MLSSALSRIFWIAFIIISIGSIGDIISQITLKPVQFKTGKNSLLTLGTPGLVFNAGISNRQNEMRAPDTNVVYTTFNKNGQKGSGNIHLNENELHNYKKDLDSIIQDIKLKREEIKLDTQITLIGEIQWEKIDYSLAMSGIDSVDVNKFIYTKTYSDEKHKKLKEIKDTFSTRAEAERFLYLGRYNTPYKISEEINEEQSLRIIPKTRSQKFLFIIFKLIIIISLALLFFNLSKIFRNFYNHNYFTYKNVRILKKIGWYILIPQIAIITFYWAFLFHIHPAKFFVSYTNISDVKLLTQYDFKSGVDWQLLFVGLSIIVLSYIFKNGLRLKEEQTLTI